MPLCKTHFHHSSIVKYEVLHLWIFLSFYFFLYSMAGFQFGEHPHIKTEPTLNEVSPEATSNLLQAT